MRVFRIIMAAMVSFAICSVSVYAGESQTLFGDLEIGATGADTTNGLWLRTYIVKRPDELQEVAFEAGSDPYFNDVDANTKRWVFDAGNFTTAQATGDSVMVIIDWEEDTGSITHKGYYAVMNDTIWDPLLHGFFECNPCTLRVMPTPDTVVFNRADLTWSEPVQDSGNPKTDNILGYNIYRSLKSVVGSANLGISFPEQLNSGVVTSPAYQDYTHPGSGDTAFYAYKIVYRPDTTGSDASDGYESLYLSPNSPPVLLPPATGIEMSGYSGYSVNGNVFIEWRTESEHGNYAWRIDRSLSPQSGFETVYYKLDDEPTTPMPTEYSFVDTKVTIGKRYYYRLADIDKEGQITWRGTIAVDVIAEDGFIEPQFMPNPFQERTSIRYVITDSGRVTLRIVDMSGRIVVTLQDGSQAVGTYRAIWNGKDNRGNDVPCGIYFFRLDTPSGESTGKLLLF